MFKSFSHQNHGPYFFRIANIQHRQTSDDVIWSIVKRVNVQMCGEDILAQVAAVEEQSGLKPGPTTQDLVDRVDCHPGPGAYQQSCEDLGCVWGELKVDGPWCNFPNYTSPPRFSNITAEDLKAAAEKFIYLDFCPLKSWYVFYKNLFSAESPNDIILTLNRMSHLQSKENLGINQKLFEKIATLLNYQSQSIMNEDKRNISKVPFMMIKRYASKGKLESSELFKNYQFIYHYQYFFCLF